MLKHTLYIIYYYLNLLALKYVYIVYFVTKFRKKNKFEIEKILN